MHSTFRSAKFEMKSWLAVILMAAILPVALPSYAFGPPSGTPNPNVEPPHDGADDEANNPKDGDPINMAKGNYIHHRVDMTVPGSRPLVFSRSYDSLRAHDNPMGWKWDHSFNTRLYEVYDTAEEEDHDISGGVTPDTYARRLARPVAQYTPPSSQSAGLFVAWKVYYRPVASTPPPAATKKAVIIALASTSGTKRLRFEKISGGSGGYTAPEGSFLTLTDLSGGGYKLRSPYGTTWTFNALGQLMQEADRNGNAWTYTYNGSGLVFRVSNGGGRYIQLLYDGSGHIVSVGDHAGRQITYTHDSAGNLTEVRLPPTPDFPVGVQMGYRYDGNHNITQAINGKREVFLQNTWDANGRVVGQVYAGATCTIDYNFAPNTTRYTDWRGHPIDYHYDADGNVLTQTIHTAGLRATDPATYVTSYAYDANFQQTKVVYPRGNWTKYTYDTFGNVIETREKKIGAADTADPANDLVKTYTYDPVYRQLTSYTDALGNTTSYALNTDGNVLSVDRPILSDTTYTYHPIGRGWIETRTDPDGTVTKYTYFTAPTDLKFGYLQSITRDFGTQPSNINATTTFTYDALGNLATVTDALGHVTTYQYNNLRQLTKIISPAPFNHETRFAYDANLERSEIRQQADSGGTAWQTVAMTYDQRGNLLTADEQGGQAVTTLAYDPAGNLSGMTDAEGKVSTLQFDERGMLWKSTDALGHVTQYDYDPNGNTTRLLDANNVPTLYTHDDFDRLGRVTYDDATFEEYTYNKVGNLATLRTRAADVFTYQYDALNRRTQKVTPEQTYTYTYDNVSRLATATNQRGTVDLDYDALDRLVQETDAHGRVLKFAYDRAGRRTRLTYPDNSFINYEYDALDRLDKIKNASGVNIADYGYDALSRYQSLAHGNGTSTSFSFDLRDNLDVLTHTLGGVAEDWDYTTNKVGVRTALDAPEGRYDFTYDDAWRLTAVDYPGTRSVSYALDPVGNRTAVTDSGSTTAYVKNTLNQYPAVGGVARTHDLNGNLASDGLRVYTHDSENRLESVQVGSGGGGTIVSYDYDALGRRITRWVNGLSPTRYTHDGWDVVWETKANNTQTVRYVTGLGVDQPLRRTHDDGSVYTYHADGLGSIVALTNASGAVVERYTYDVYGQVTITDASGGPLATSGVGNETFFTGRQLDPVTGLYHYRARDYDPATGRFVQPDPWKYVDGPNMYAYVVNDPVNFTDPNGRKLHKPVQWVYKLGKKISKPVSDWAGDKVRKYSENKGNKKARERADERRKEKEKEKQSEENPPKQEDPPKEDTPPAKSDYPGKGNNPAKGDMKSGSGIDKSNPDTWPDPPGNKGPFKPGDPSRKSNRDHGEKSLYDSEGGEWKPHVPDKYHPEGHWDYRPPGKHQQWQNIPAD